MKLTCGRVISSIFILCILLSLWITTFDKTRRFVNYAKFLLKNSMESTDVYMDYEDREFDELQSKISAVDIKFMESQIEDLSQKRSYVQNISVYPPTVGKFTGNGHPDSSHDLLYLIEEAQDLYENCIRYLKIERWNNTLCSFAQSVTSNNQNGLGDLLQRIEKYVKSRKESLYHDFPGGLIRHFIEPRHFCGHQHSIQHNIYEPYELLIRNEEIAFSTYKHLYRQLTQCFQGNYTYEMKLAFGEIARRTRNYRLLISEVITDLSREVRPCEPRPYIRNENTFELERFDRSIIIDAMRLNSWYKCVNECRDIFRTQHFGNISVSKYTINMTHCESCEFDDFNLICHEPPDQSSTFIEVYDYEDPDDIFSQSFRIPFWCKPTVSDNTKWDILENRKYHCLDCACQCKNPDVDIKWRYAISLRPQESNIAENMIVTGIKFHRTGNANGVKVIYPQIKVAKLSIDGLSEGVWQDVGNFDNSSWPSGEVGVDYVFLGRDANQSRIFSLNGNKEKPGYVVTGVKFQLRSDPYRESRYTGDIEKSLEIVVRMTPCNLITGKLSVSGSTYVDPDAEMGATSQKDVQSDSLRRISSETTDENLSVNRKNAKPDIEHRQYLEISYPYRQKNFRQTTILYFDLRPVDPTPAFPLSGIDLFHEDQRNNGGFLAFKVTTINVVDLMKSPRYNNFHVI